MPLVIITISAVGVYFLNWRTDKIGFLILGFSAFLWAVYSWDHSRLQSANYLFSTVVSVIGWWRFKNAGK